jgi:hypothetical protein
LCWKQWFDEEDESDDDDYELKCNESILTCDHDAHSESSRTDKSEDYSGESSSLDEGTSFRKAFQVGGRRF